MRLVMLSFFAALRNEGLRRRLAFQDPLFRDTLTV